MTGRENTEKDKVMNEGSKKARKAGEGAKEEKEGRRQGGKIRKRIR
jgi:hypothetical protein